MTSPLVSVRGIRKRFGVTLALDQIDLDLEAGEIHAVLGENGAGKSTLMNLLGGVLRPDEGALRINGRNVEFSSPRDARKAGVGMVHQHFMLFAALTVAENLALVTSRSRSWYEPAVVARRATDLAQRVGLHLERFDTRVGELPVGAQQRLEILKALADEPNVLILDEPTAVLTPAETEQLFGILRQLRTSGRLVIFITHKLREAKDLADRITILRRGRVVGTFPAADLSERDMAEHMVGEVNAPPVAIAPAGAVPRRGSTAAALQVANLSVTDSHGKDVVRDVSFTVRAGEIFGIGGVDGNGQRELFETIVGLQKPARGEVRIGGRVPRRHDPGAVVEAGLAHIPPDRHREGLVLAMSVLENILLSAPLRRRLSRFGILQHDAARRFAADLVERYDIRTPSLDVPARALSGGNQQRVVVARELAQRPKVLLTVNPTRGLDIAAARAVSGALLQVAAQGCAVVLISTDLDEILELGDRIAILARGRLSEPMRPPVDAERLGLLMAGAAEG